MSTPDTAPEPTPAATPATSRERPDGTAFAAELERLVVDQTERLLSEVDRLAERHGASASEVRGLLVRYGGHDVADWWDEYLG